MSDDRINTKRGLMVLDGMVGFLIATVVLVVVVLSLAYLSYDYQTANATNYYEMKNADQIKSGIMGKEVSNQADHIVDVK